MVQIHGDRMTKPYGVICRAFYVELIILLIRDKMKLQVN